MKIPVLAGLNALDVIRRAGYGQVRDQRATETSYARRMGSGLYPRFHIYFSNESINLHLDQKQASYEGSNAHSGEYEGEVVEAEGERIKEAMAKMNFERFSGPDTMAEPEKKGFFRNFFGG